MLVATRPPKSPSYLVRLLLLGAIVVVTMCLFASATSPTAPFSQTNTRSSGLTTPGNSKSQTLPVALEAAYRQALQQNVPTGYQPTNSAVGQYQLNNPTNHLKAGFSKQGLELNGWKMRLASYGYSGEARITAAQLSPVTNGQRVEYRYPGGLTEWYLNSELGLEQGFSLQKPLAGNDTVGIELTLNLEGVRASGAKNSEWLELSDGMRYGKLVAWDSTGRKLNSQLETSGSEIVLKVDGRGAVYPLTIDPYLQQQTLTASDEATEDFFGSSISLSSDGNIALIGAYNKTIGNNSSQGAAYLFTRAGNNWSQQQLITPSDGAAGDYFGNDVSLSSDGNTALVGAYNKTIGNNSGQGAVYVFVRSGNSWSQQQRLTASDGSANDGFGKDVFLSGDGNTAMVGSPNKTIGTNSHQGSAYIFRHSGASWSQPQRLTTVDGTADDIFGSSVSLSSDGNTALIGAAGKSIGTNSGQGAVYVFVRVGSAWSQQQKLTAAYGIAFDRFGSRISLSNDGNTALVGVSSAYYLQGAVYLFTRAGSNWTQQQLLTPSDGVDHYYFGSSVSLSSDGNTALIGAFTKNVGNNSVQGAVYVFSTGYSTSAFRDPAFLALWNKSDKPLVDGKASRSWLWGPQPFFTALEEYAQAPRGYRLVEYFDKSRMEINDPTADKTNPYFVTNGLLASEMMKGQIQVGDAQFKAKAPALIPVAGDPDDTTGPTYATLGQLLTIAPAPLNSHVTATLNRAGNVGEDPTKASFGVKGVYCIQETNHTIASPFWDYLNSTSLTYDPDDKPQTGPLFSPTFYATGLPLTEAYWAKVKVGGEVKDVLVQAFERRVLTYTPTNPSGFQVEMGNVGRHYYDWRYGN